MYVCREHRNVIEEFQARHTGIASGVIGRHAPLITPKNMYAAPVHLVTERRTGKKFIQPFRGMASRKCDNEAAESCDCFICQMHEEFSGAPAKCFMVGMDTNYSRSSVATRHV